MAAVARCPRCGADRVSPLVCPRCRSVESASGDAFALLGLPRSWGVDPQELEDRYAAVSSLLEPESEEAARLGAARRTLSDPLARARYLIGLYGGDTSDKPVESSEFLTEVMELRRGLEEAMADRDEGRLASVVAEAEEKLGSLIMALGQSFARLEKALVDEVAEASRSLAGATYWSQLVDELRSKAARLEKQRPERRTEGKETFEL